MAVKKKAENLTIEEKLARALVPESEQPYEVPKNWCWVRLESLITTSKEKTEDFSDDYLKYVGLEHIERDNGIVGYGTAKELKSLKNVFRVGQILYGKLRPYLNKHDVAHFCGVCSTDILVFNPLESVVPHYVNYYLNQQLFIEYVVSNSKGINLPRVSEDIVLNALCPLPPFAEQKRIVERIESLFVKLDEAKEKLQEVLDGFETRKAAILHKAFSGELTAKWREEHGVSLDSWRYLAFKDIADIKSNLVEPSMYLELPHIAPDNIEKNTGKLLEYRTVLEDNLKSAKHHFFDGQILYSKIRPNLSKVVMVDFEGLCSADMYPIEAYEDSKYLWYYMLSNNFLVQACNASSRSVLPKINQKELSRIKVVVPSILEQRCIVGILDEHMRKEDMLKIKTEEALEKLDGIKKAILARAFRGELGTNDENDECAVELLKRVLW